MFTRIRALVGGIVLALTASLGFAGPSWAEPAVTELEVAPKAQCQWDYAASGVNIRALPNTSSTIRGQGNPGDCIIYRGQWIQGENVYCPLDGRWSDLWLEGTNGRTGVRGWINSCYFR